MAILNFDRISKLFVLQGVSLGSTQESFNSSREESLDIAEGDSFADDDNHSNAAVSSLKCE